MENGHFRGSVERRILDRLGRMEEKIWEDETGHAMSRHVYTNRPAGKVRDESYMNGKLFNVATFRYDSQGNVVESQSQVPRFFANLFRRPSIPISGSCAFATLR
jgi:hypothetical protein